MSRRPRSQQPLPSIEEIFRARLQSLTSSSPQYYRTVIRRFLSFLQTHFPQVLQLPQLSRDAHVLGWVRSLQQQDPPLSNTSRRIYLLALRRLLRELATDGHSVPSGLILPEDFPQQPVLKRHRPIQPQVHRTPAPRALPHPVFAAIFYARIQNLATTLRPQTVQSYQAAARRFLCYLQTDFPHLESLPELSRDPHLLGWLQHLRDQYPPLSAGTRQLYLLKLRRLFRALESDGYPLQRGLLLPADIPAARRPRIRPALPPPHVFQPLFEAALENFTTAMRPETAQGYRRALRRFLAFLQTDFPELLQLSDLRRDPHLLAWFRRLRQQDPPLAARTRQDYLFAIRRLLAELALLGHAVRPGLIVREDFPPLPHYLPRALSPDDDQRLQQELRRIDDLHSNALLLTRATGIRIGECINLATDCLRSLGNNEWALHVPLGKLYTERLVPVDEDVRHILTRIQTLRELDPCCRLEASAGLLLPRAGRPKSLYWALRRTLQSAAQRAGCSCPVTCHQLRHTYASEMLRLGVSLPALMHLLGHKNIRMTLRYLQITQQDLQREFHLARQAAPHHHCIPHLHLSDAAADLSGIQRAVAATRHLLTMYRRRLTNEKIRRRLQRLDRRLLDIASQLKLLATAEK